MKKQSIFFGQTQIEPLISQLADRLSGQGYEVVQKATIKGESGTEHAFDILARQNHGFVAYTGVAGVITDADDPEIGLMKVLNFDDKCYDCGIQHKVLIALPWLSSVASEFTQEQHIKVFGEQTLKAFLASPPSIGQVAEDIPIRFSAKSEVAKALRLLGYQVEENAKVTGKSGVEYNFDILASLDDGFLTIRLGVDHATGDIDSNQLSLFSAKCEDADINEKALLVSGKLTAEVKQLAEKERIKLTNLIRERRAIAVEEAEPRTGLMVSQPEALQLVPEATARRFTVIPLAITNNSLEVAMVNPSDIPTLQVLEYQSKMRIKPVAAEEKAIQESIDFNYKGFRQIEERVAGIDTGVGAITGEDLIQATADTPVASALHLIIDEATKSRASDIHIEPEEKRLRIRYRIDGVLQEVMALPSKIQAALTSRIKIMAGMNITDHLHAQDGQFSIESRGKMIDVRVATGPTVHGETTSLRLLDKSLAILDLPNLGFSPEALAKYDNLLKVPFGMILTSGPTGAGKTTTLYASVNTLDRVSRNIITIEDPAEYRFDSISQIQVNPKAGITFAGGLRSILRMDPDVILVGEIRDAETAKIAVQSALTGHLVLTSIHANDAVGVIFRLLDLGVEPFLVCSAVIGVLAQRMVRRICPDCSRYVEASPLEQLAYEKWTGERVDKFLYGSGCERCAHSGYRGRTGIFEILAMSDEIRMLILKEASAPQIRQQALKEGMTPLIMDGLLKVKQGITTVSEVLRNAYFIE